MAPAGNRTRDLLFKFTSLTIEPGRSSEHRYLPETIKYTLLAQGEVSQLGVKNGDGSIGPARSAAITNPSAQRGDYGQTLPLREAFSPAVGY
ncbi:jg23739 [Pararge aegeria aegeria]|uniref:Jg23739 protein n=1 Tax=Pararge aegeria aegeria TaxID=348720 RepID=A0A8S4RBB5_9NEOP|nr:jg23739 [Pararge aegeria aegeria]